MAHHYAEAGLSAQAPSLAAGRRAGPRALGQSRNGGAPHAGAGASVTLPDTPERPSRNSLQTTRPRLVATKGQASPEVNMLTPGRARFAAGMRPRSSSRCWCGAYGSWCVPDPLGFTDGAGAGGATLTLAQHIGDPALLLEAHYALEQF